MLQEPRHESGPLPFSVEDIGPEQKKLDFAHVIERLQRELEELNEQKNNLIEERPFIWSIEFPEIFFERGGFDIVIGNPPYVRQEHISDPNGNLDPATYKDALTEMVLIDFPSHFAKSELEHLILNRDGNQVDVQICIPIFIFVLYGCSTRMEYMFSFVQFLVGC